MNYPFLQKTVLAVAITAASSQVSAVTVDITSGPFQKGAESIDFLTINGNIDLSGNSGPLDIVNLDGTTISGNVTNNASIVARSDYADAIDIENSTVSKIINSGTISAIGIAADALTLEDSAIGELNNSSTIKAQGPGANAIEIDGGSLVRLVNTGNILATGDGNSAAILISDAVEFNPGNVASNGDSGIINSGTIKADGVAIKVEPTNQLIFQIFHKGGLIEGAVAAIDAKGKANLTWTGGIIRGDLLDIYEINSGGNNTFDGNVMRAPFLDLYEGTLTLQKPHSELQGTLEMSSTSALEMLIGNSTDNTKPVLNVTGGAEFESGSKIKLTPRPDDFATSTPEKNYVLVKTGSAIDNKGLSVQSTSALLDVKSFNVSSNTVEAVVAAKSDQGVIDTVKTGGGNQNAQRAQVAFTNSVISKLNSNNPVYQAFANATTNQQIAALAKQLAPQTNGGATQGARSALGATLGAIGGRSSAGRGASTGDVLQEQGLWLQALHSDADQDMRDGIAGYDADSKGIAIGADGKLNEQTTIGLAYSYLDTDVQSDDGNKTQVDSHALTAYASWQDGPWFVDGSLTYGVNDNESKRYVVGTEAKGDYDSDLVGVNALAGYVYRLNDSVLLEPRVAARYSNVDIDSYREKGSAAALDVGAARFEVGELGAGVRMAGAFALGQGTLEPEAKLMAYHDVIGDKTDSTSSFTLGGTPFVTNGASPVRDSYEAGVGVTYKLGALSVGASYDYLGKTDFNADTFNAKVRYDF